MLDRVTAHQQEAPAQHAPTQVRPTLGREMKIRSMVTIAGEILPFVWPMRNFINHNPLHGLEHLPFAEAIERATTLFHARGFLRRGDYQALLAEGRIDHEVLAELIDEFLAEWSDATDQADRAERADPIDRGGAPLDLRQLLLILMTQMDQPIAGAGFPSEDQVIPELRQALEP